MLPVLDVTEQGKPRLRDHWQGLGERHERWAPRHDRPTARSGPARLTIRKGNRPRGQSLGTRRGRESILSPEGIRIHTKAEEDMGGLPAFPILVGPRAPGQQAQVQEHHVREGIEPARPCQEEPRAPAERRNEVHKRCIVAPNSGNSESQCLRSGKPKIGPSPPDLAAPPRRPILEEPPNQKLIQVGIDPPRRPPRP
jgi:hypothetical protein